MSRSSIFRVITVVIGLLGGMLLAEAGYRTYHYITHSNLSDLEAGNRPAVIKPNEEISYGEVIQLSSNQKIIYELIPGSKYLYQGVLIETNEKGFRDQGYPSKKSKNTVRIIGLGDSVMFGWGVEEEQCFMSQLEDSLNHQSDIMYEVINTAVPGYNTVMEIATLKAKTDLTQVDLVILSFVENDISLPNFIRKDPDYTTIQKSFILQHFENNGGRDKRLRNAPMNEQYGGFLSDPDKVPVEYVDMVGEEANASAMRELKLLSREHDFEVVLVYHSPYNDFPVFVKEICRELQFETASLKDEWKEHQIRFPEAEWSISKKDPHPNTHGHTVIGNALTKKVRALIYDNAELR